ncbi:hypothetical protein V6N12_027905 [Hibiscus sabdariffa]|uniref:non-specific serine/threonine protein kinase n=1 Tax=Hibiscus sabdariffa TaxID=183260 RepID=A0ABR2F499_9ROSI
MSSSFTNPILLGILWATIILTFATTLSTADQSPLESEAKALLESGWWSGYHNISRRCKWPGISCNAAGSITEMTLSGAVYNYSEVQDRFGELKFSSFPNLVVLDLSGCQLGGNIPPEIADLSALKYLGLSSCDLSGELPLSLGNLTNLEFLDISSNSIHGSIPPQLGKLEKLVSLNLSWTGLTGQIPTSLGTLTNLRHLQLSGNQFDEGPIPQNFRNLTALVTLKLDSCGITGPIPSGFGQLTNLEILGLYGNKINGSIPPEIGLLSNLLELHLHGNMLVGSIPITLYQLTNLKYFLLGINHLEGSIPQDIENLKNLRILSLTDNNFTGHIPLVLCHLTKLEFIDIGLNQFSGSIPSCFGNLSNLNYLSLRSNLLEGSIPQEIGNLEKLTLVDLSQNSLNGSIPSQIGNLSRLTYLDLSFNQLSGHVPVLSATKLHIVDAENGCYKISPDSFQGNKGLSPCITSSKTSTANNSKIPLYIKIFLPIAIFSTFSILGCLFFSWFKVKNSRVGIHPTKNGDICSIWNYDGKIAYEDIIAATEDFDFRYCIGVGGYGSVYRAQLPCGKVVALKKLHRSEAENPAFDKSFRNEIKFLTEIRHRNIVKLHGFCLHRRSMFLIYEYMEKGSLFYNLRDEVEAVEMDWTKRIEIIKGMAHALCYLHHDCSPPIVHRDISSNNVLLNSSFEAFVADFGTARMLDLDSSNQTLLVGTLGYIAPGDVS